MPAQWRGWGWGLSAVFSVNWFGGVQEAKARFPNPGLTFTRLDRRRLRLDGANLAVEIAVHVAEFFWLHLLDRLDVARVRTAARHRYCLDVLRQLHLLVEGHGVLVYPLLLGGAETRNGRGGPAFAAPSVPSHPEGVTP